MRLLNGDSHEGKQLEVFLSPVTSWRASLCNCNHPKSCNYLHVFRNPADEYDVRNVEDKSKERKSSRHSKTEESSRSHRSERTSTRQRRSPGPKHSNTNTREVEKRVDKRPSSHSVCISFVKRGICPYGERCRHRHDGLDETTVMVVLNYFKINDWGGEEDEMAKYEEFYHEALERFQSVGTVTMFKCCSNNETLLDGTVYVQYSTHDELVQAHEMFNGLFYMGRTLKAELCPPMDWNRTICGQWYNNRECHYRGKKKSYQLCPGLHVYHNPDGQFPKPPYEVNNCVKDEGEIKGETLNNLESKDIAMGWL